MRRWLCTLAGVVVAATAGGDAQSTVYLVFPASTDCRAACTGQLLTIDPDTPAIRESQTLPYGFGLDALGLYVTPDGGALVWVGGSTPLFPHSLAILTLASRAISASDTALSEFFGHPGRPEVYASDAQGPIALSPAGVRRFASLSCGSPFPPRPWHMSGDGTRVSYRCGSDEVLFDTASGARGRAFADGGWSALSPDGASFYAMDQGRTLRRHAADTGVSLAEVSWSNDSTGMVIDQRTGDLYRFTPSEVAIYDGLTLTLRRTLPNAVPFEGGSWVFDRFRPRAYVSIRRAQFDSYYIVDTDTLTVTTSAELPRTGANMARFVVAYRPAAPAGLVHDISGATVTLAWQAGLPAQGVPTRYLLEAGSAPGLSDIFSGLDVGLQTSFAASGVPPGTYYVRVRAGNYSGLSAPSNEVAVVVP